MIQNDKNRKLDSKKIMEAFKVDDSNGIIDMIIPFAEKNDPEALVWLAVCYESGFGVERNGSKALELYKKALELGSGLAAHNLGTLYLSGIPGVSKDGKLSKYYYQKAKEMGAQFANDEFYE